MQTLDNAIKATELGAHSQYEMNRSRTYKLNIDTFCAHCAKAMTAGNGYEARWLYTGEGDGVWLPMTSEQGEITLLGNECVKKWFSAEQLGTYASKVGA